MSHPTESPHDSRFHTLFERAPVAIWDEDFSRVKELISSLNLTGAESLRQRLQSEPGLVAEAIRRVRVRHVNRIAREFYGARTEEELILALPMLFDESAVAVFIDEITALSEGSSTFSAELVTSTLAGERRLVQMNVAVLPTEDDDWSQVVVAFTDLTERRRLEQSLQRANDQLRRVNSDLEQFAYAAAHDLREPLRTITLYGQMLRTLGPERAGSQGDIALGYILENAGRMKALIADLLEFARTIEPLDPTMCPLIDPAATATEVLTTVAGAIEQAGARVEIAGDLPLVAIQAGHLRQLLQNLIVNAIKYRSPDRPAEIRVSASCIEDAARFCVADNGIGINPEYHERIFGIFDRLHGNEIEGTGIGLALCRKIVEKYDGRLWVESRAGEGSSFYFTVPRGMGPRG